MTKQTDLSVVDSASERDAKYLMAAKNMVTEIKSPDVLLDFMTDIMAGIDILAELGEKIPPDGRLYPRLLIDWMVGTWIRNKDDIDRMAWGFEELSNFDDVFEIIEFLIKAHAAYVIDYGNVDKADIKECNQCLSLLLVIARLSLDVKKED